MSLDFGQFEVVSFDCYGTLIDWESGLLAALRPILSHHRIEISDQTILETYAEIEARLEKGDYLPYRTILQRSVQELGQRYHFVPTLAEIESLPASLASWHPFPDTVAALQALKQRYRLTIISNIDPDLFAGSAQHLQVPFDWVVTAQHVGAYKPSTRPFQRASEIMQIPVTKQLHVAQSLYHDVMPARSLGLATVWVNRRQHQPGFGATPPAEAQPDLEVPDLQTLVDRIGLFRSSIS
jgi:2-haloacid dehalogenase